ncbi:MAG TPA: efflux RND transporter periplasmic adaptor subunit [Steroidobacteraceae bacterium]|nr:efflux RND transporter periplasmic adaptor subunit [Steroidobacteraceae bacterium]
MNPESNAKAVRNGRLSSRDNPRWRWLAIAAGVFVVCGLTWSVYWLSDARWRVTTDDAYVDGNVVEITPQISGTVVAIGADDTQLVRAGQPLVKLDPADAQLALDEADARLARSVREVRNLFATSAELNADVELRASELAMAQKDLARRERLGSSGAISGEELQHARDTVRGDRAALNAAKEQLAANRARTDGTTLASHPDVRDAAAAVRSAYLQLSRTVLPAPVAGLIAKRNVQLGERVNPGAALMSVVPLDQVWVEANFKEPQLASLRIGQPVSVTSDLYGRKVIFHGRVAGLGAGTGSAFALLPAQNATGNWIKIVQRVPVRIALDPRELEAHPLQIGLSMKVEVSIRDQDGKRFPQAAGSPTGGATDSAAALYATSVFDASGAAAEARVRTIIAANAPAPQRSSREHARLASAAHARSAPIDRERDASPAAAAGPAARETSDGL